MDETTRILIRARRRLADPERWTKGTTARDRRGRPVHPSSRAAVRWCAMGALHAECLTASTGDRFEEALRRLAAVIELDGWRRPPGIADLNDGLGHEAVLELFDAAIRAK